MPNGFHSPKEEWERVKRPLCEIDGPLAEFARSKRITVTENERNWPGRSLRWTEEGVEKLIQVYLEDEERLTYSLWICASQDRAGNRSWKKATLASSADISDISGTIQTVLEKAYDLLGSWTAEDLEYASPSAGVAIKDGILTMSDCPEFKAKVLAGPRALRILHRIMGLFARSGKGQ